jgi:hypothetical protein
MDKRTLLDRQRGRELGSMLHAWLLSGYKSVFVHCCKWKVCLTCILVNWQIHSSIQAKFSLMFSHVLMGFLWNLWWFVGNLTNSKKMWKFPFCLRKLIPPPPIQENNYCNIYGTELLGTHRWFDPATFSTPCITTQSSFRLEEVQYCTKSP